MWAIRTCALTQINIHHGSPLASMCAVECRVVILEEEKNKEKERERHDFVLWFFASLSVPFLHISGIICSFSSHYSLSSLLF